MDNWINHRQGKLVLKITLEDVRPVVDELKRKKDRISKRKVGKILGKTADYLRKDYEINSFLEQEIQQQLKQMDREFRRRIDTAIIDLKQDTGGLSFRKVAKMIGIDVNRILENGNYKRIVETAIDVMEIEKINMVKMAIATLQERDQQINFTSILRKTGFPRSYIESNLEVRKLILSSIEKQSSNN